MHSESERVLMMARFYLAIARMAELVDALVSNTNGAIRAGSIPAPGTTSDSQFCGSLFLCLYVTEQCEWRTRNRIEHLEIVYRTVCEYKSPNWGYVSRILVIFVIQYQVL